MAEVLRMKDINQLLENDRLKAEIAILIERGKLKTYEVKI